MRDHYLPASFLAIGLLAVVTATAYGVAVKRTTHTETPISIDTENVVFAINQGPADAERDVIVLPEVRITATRDPLAGVGKKCSAGAWFGSRPLEQGSGNVRGFCP